MSTKMQKWIEAGKVLVVNPDEKIICPECEQGDLQVKDIRSETDVDILERKIYCPICGANNYLRLRRPL